MYGEGSRKGPNACRPRFGKRRGLASSTHRILMPTAPSKRRRRPGRTGGARSSPWLQLAEALAWERIRSGAALNSWRVDDPVQAELYEIVGDPAPLTMDLWLEDFYVWQFDDGRAELRATYKARAEAVMEGLHVPDPWIGFDGTRYYEDDGHPALLDLDCFADLTVEASADVEGDGLSEPALEDVYRA